MRSNDLRYNYFYMRSNNQINDKNYERKKNISINISIKKDILFYYDDHMVRTVVAITQSTFTDASISSTLRRLVTQHSVS